MPCKSSRTSHKVSQMVSTKIRLKVLHPMLVNNLRMFSNKPSTYSPMLASAYSMVQVSAFISPYCSHSNCSTKKFSNAVLILHQLSNCKQRRQYESAVCIPTSQFQSTKLRLLCRSLDRNVTSIHTLPCHKQISVNYVNDLLCTDSVLHNVK